MRDTILVIDDDDINCEMMVFMITSLHGKAVTAADGAQGIARAQRDAPALIFCDVRMPVLNGYQTLARLRADPHLAHVPVIAMTAHAMLGDRQKMLAAGFDGYISKPFELAEIEHHIHAHLAPRVHARPEGQRAADSQRIATHAGR